jgi:di/tricarboxylate transporter
MPLEQFTFLLILGAGLVLFVTERLRVDVTAMLILVALGLTGILTAREAVSGLASEPAVVVAAVFVLSSGLAATGLADRMGSLLMRLAGGSEWRAIAVIIPAVAARPSRTTCW